MRHILTLFDLSVDEIRDIFRIAAEQKTLLLQGNRQALFPGRVMGLLFEKPSLRTRVSFEAAIAHLGGSSLFLGKDVGWGTRESMKDFAGVLSQYVDVIVCRSRDHDQIADMARQSDCPVINGLSSISHPCQALSDLFTLNEIRGSLSGATLSYVGDGNNVARSLAVACGKLGVRIKIATPPAYAFEDCFLEHLRQEIPELEIFVMQDPLAAVEDADVVYTDVWASMGQESEMEARRHNFKGYQINAELMAAAPASACFLHCLPAHRGHEVTDEVMDGPQSRVVQQAANRMHVQKGILAWLLGG